MATKRAQMEAEANAKAKRDAIEAAKDIATLRCAPMVAPSMASRLQSPLPQLPS